MTIHVFIADDHAIVRNGLCMLLEAQTDFEVVGEAAQGLDAVSQVIALQPDVVVMDIAMPDLNGLDATVQILEVCPCCKIVILSMYSSLEHISRAFQVGAKGFVEKESAGTELIRAIRSVASGKRYLCSKASKAVAELEFGRSANLLVKSPLDSLSSREREVLHLVVEGKTSVEIALVLGLSSKTVETYRSRLLHKLGLSDLTQLVKFAIQHGLTPP